MGIKHRDSKLQKKILSTGRQNVGCFPDIFYQVAIFTRRMIIFAIRMNNYNNQYTLGEVLQQLIDKFRLRNRMNSETLQAAWPEIAGALVARHTKSVQLDGPVLYIEVDEPALRNELLYMQSDIIKAVNERLHNNAVEKLVIR